MTIAVDFDGTLHTGEFPDIGSPADGAIETMKALRDDGHYLILWTCRCGDRLTEAINWMLEQGIPFHRVNDNKPSNVALYGTNSRKIAADLFIDDKNTGGLSRWNATYQYAQYKEREYNKRKDGVT